MVWVQDYTEIWSLGGLDYYRQILSWKASKQTDNKINDPPPKKKINFNLLLFQRGGRTNCRRFVMWLFLNPRLICWEHELPRNIDSVKSDRLLDEQTKVRLVCPTDLFQIVTIFHVDVNEPSKHCFWLKIILFLQICRGYHVGIEEVYILKLHSKF